MCYNTCSACVPDAILGCTDASANNYNADADTDDNSCLYSTTFNVDMNCAGVDFYEVFVTGPLWGWPANAGFNQLLDGDGDGIYSVTIETPAGDIEYKYAINGFADQENLIDDMQNGASCAPVTDYSGYANRLDGFWQHHQRHLRQLRSLPRRGRRLWLGRFCEQLQRGRHVGRQLLLVQHHVQRGHELCWWAFYEVSIELVTLWGWPANSWFQPVVGRRW